MRAVDAGWERTRARVEVSDGSGQSEADMTAVQTPAKAPLCVSGLREKVRSDRRAKWTVLDGTARSGLYLLQVV